jgi:hypothetical protein
MVTLSAMERMVMKYQCGVVMIIWGLDIILKSWSLLGNNIIIILSFNQAYTEVGGGT